jgi:hypothetical protein
MSTDLLNNPQNKFRVRNGFVYGLSQLLNEFAQTLIQKRPSCPVEGSSAAVSADEVGTNFYLKRLLALDTNDTSAAFYIAGFGFDARIARKCSKLWFQGRLSMEPHSLGRKLGIGLRVAGMIAKDRAGNAPVALSNAASKAAPVVAEARVTTQRVAAGAKAGGRSLFGPLAKVARALWHEVTGVFFGLFTAVFTSWTWKAHQSWQSGPEHQKFILSAIASALFLYLTITAFWRARR